MDLPLLRRILDDVRFPDYEFEVQQDLVSDRLRMRAGYMDEDIVTGKTEAQYTRWWDIPEMWNRDQVVQTAFKCVLTSKEHYTREHFKYRGRAIFGPHFNVDDLWQIAAYVKEHP